MARTLGYLLMIFSGTFVLPILVGLRYGEPIGSLLANFGIPAVVTATFGGILMLLGGKQEDLRDREAFISVSLAYLLISLFGCLPYMISGALPNILDAFFESTSGFTTTGSSVMVDVENFGSIPHSIILWRSETALVGGMGIIVLSMVVLSRIVGGSMQLFKAESSVHATIKMRPTIRQIALTLWVIYLAFVLAEMTFLSFAGMDLFDAACHSFTTLSTCGFSSRNAGVSDWNSNPWIGTIVTIFMLLGGMSFTLHYDWLTGKMRKVRENVELQVYLGLFGLSSVIIFCVLFTNGTYSTVGEMASHSIFNTASIMTTTGYASSDFALWPSGPQLLLIFLMLIGAMSGSTAGGIKAIRFIVLLKLVRREIQKIIHPRAIMPITLGGRPITEETQRNVVVYFFIYIIIFCLVALGLAIVGMTIPEGLAASAQALGGVGPALGHYGPMSTYASLHPVGKILICFNMWLGRLEIYPALLLFSPGAYRR
jgi:trk system potassium uptake protein TrkH